MQVEQINEAIEAIETIVHFAPGKITLHRFKWRERMFIVRRTLYKTSQREGENRILLFSVKCDSNDVFRISFNLLDFTWRLESVTMNG